MPSKADSKPLPLSDTLRDLALLRASSIDLSNLVTHNPSPDPTNEQNDSAVEEATQRSFQLVKEGRAALRVFNSGELDKQETRLEEVSTQAQEVLKGLYRDS
ncbi:hypothetical protein BJ138DRAFT_101640 [Hygrophoropsis aurantiaca]|uniref:Uncharacterized protein n=1 Tax=Hygrophoropsis aurantiaca TaxID=72124 RepID=A0ACB8ABM8_9AGAM|nr:hypothetical protein BJ138DRAFT_101640 [Hygrophoropsis aurantiaca]